MTGTAGATRTAAAFVSPGGRARLLRGAMVTADRYRGGNRVVRCQDRKMKQAWCLAASSTSATSRALMSLMASAGESNPSSFAKHLFVRPRSLRRAWDSCLSDQHAEDPTRLCCSGLPAIALLTLLEGLPAKMLGYDRFSTAPPIIAAATSLLPGNITLLFLPPYSPELRTPKENLWDEMPPKIFQNSQNFRPQNQSTPCAPSSKRRSSTSNAIRKTVQSITSFP